MKVPGDSRNFAQAPSRLPKPREKESVMLGEAKYPLYLIENTLS